ncbi:tripartite tricarboxylate transporter permease [Nocardiopsis sediminis]|uniref:Tripartite tricarboxylate transporter permease n=1 Tax=Nocardiopsis sediminis TaxID=1778267 RepID=A0ABV8FTV9_9ACTN
MIDNLMMGLGTALTPENLLWCFVGVLAGTVIGLLPGLGSSTGVAVLLPLTLGFEPVTALIMLAGIYYGAQYGGTITSVLISTPGEASSVATTFDGYQMARRGRAGAALSIAAIGSFVAAIASLILLSALAPAFARFALNFGPAENLAVMVLGLATIVGFSGGSQLRGVAMAGVGLLLATVGIDSATAESRFTFGSTDLLGGIPFVEVMIGLFAVGEVMYQLRVGEAVPIRAKFRDLMITREELKRSGAPIVRGSIIGFLLGCLPGAGSTLASFMAYGVEKRVSRHRDEFGKGAIEGVAAPESANNSAANANFIPTLALGIPGGATTAILLGALIVYGVQPGPLMFEEQPELVWGLLASFFIGNLMLLVLNLPLAPLFAQMLRIPYAYLYPLIICTSFVGAYSIDNSLYSVWIVFVFGVVGYLMKLLDLPIAPLVLGLVLGPLFEKALVQTSALGDGSFILVAQSPIAVATLALAIVLAAGPSLLTRLRRRAGRTADEGPPTDNGPVPTAPGGAADREER